MAGVKPVGALDVTGALEEERAAFVTLLEQLSADDWTHSTECPAWTSSPVSVRPWDAVAPRPGAAPRTSPAPAARSARAAASRSRDRTRSGPTRRRSARRGR